ncbi:MAG: toll/interleukin-1 receptor domain-containing protein [Chloroflexi bacterium]|nr:toll/interleukin-1 receptor domain-containing protein [Chloroflexota bacterium]
MGHIFISYSKKDVGYAEKLINALRREGFNPWFDIEGLEAGTHWQNRLQKQIFTCDAYILLMSRNAFNSKWVPDELVTAKTKNKPIFPLLLDDTELFLGIQTVQVEDVRGGKLPSEVFYQRLATITPRQKKAGQKIASVRLEEKARKQKADKAAEKASHYLSRLASNVKDAIAVTSKISSNAYRSIAKSRAVKKISSTIKRKTRPNKKKR